MYWFCVRLFLLKNCVCLFYFIVYMRQAITTFFLIIFLDRVILDQWCQTAKQSEDLIKYNCINCLPYRTRYYNLSKVNHCLTRYLYVTVWSYSIGMREVGQNNLDESIEAPNMSITILVYRRYQREFAEVIRNSEIFNKGKLIFIYFAFIRGYIFL